MTPTQLKHQEALLARNDAALERWPDRSGEAFTHTMEEVARGLEALAREVDATGGDQLERSRNWRYVGNAYFDLAQGKDVNRLKLASGAYQKAETLLEGVRNTIETMKLNYSYGQALMGLSEGTHLALAREAKRRFSLALTIARRELPAAVAPAERELANANRVVALLEVSDNLSGEIESLKEKIRYSPSSEDSGPENTESMIPDLFGILQQEFEAEKSKGTMDTVRQNGLESIMARLGKLIDNIGPDQTLDQQIEDRGELNDLMKEMRNRMNNPSFKQPKPPEDSRASRILAHIQTMKTLVGMGSTHTGKSSGESEKAIDLYYRLARLTTTVNQSQGDTQRLLRIEVEDLRHLMNEARWYARCHHLTLAYPVWSRQGVPQDPNFIFFSGPDEIRDSLEHAAKAIGLTVSPSISLGSDTTMVRWHNLSTAGLAVFDISKKNPQVFYNLGIALTMGIELLIIAKEGTDVPFDIAQDVWFYSGDRDLREFLASKLDATLYGLQIKGSRGSSLKASIAYIERLAATEPDNQNLPVLLQRLHALASDPVKIRSVFTVINDSLGAKSHILIYPRWPGVYPDPLTPRCFIVMPFREELDNTYDMIQQECRQAGITPCRGDVARGQEIIQSIWEEIGRATHVVVDLTGLNPNVCLELGIADTLGRRTLLIGRQGTERALFPSIAKRRCHAYHPNHLDEPNFVRAVKNFLSSPKQ